MRKNKLLKQDIEAMRIAARYNMTSEYKAARRAGLSPSEALEDWDLLPFDSKSSPPDKNSK